MPSSISPAGSTPPSDVAYDATSWNGVTTIAPSKNAVRDEMELKQTAAQMQALIDSMPRLIGIATFDPHGGSMAELVTYGPAFIGGSVGYNAVGIYDVVTVGAVVMQVIVTAAHDTGNSPLNAIIPADLDMNGTFQIQVFSSPTLLANAALTDDARLVKVFVFGTLAANP